MKRPPAASGTMVALRPLVSLAFGIAAVTGGAERARASCAITLEGDPTTVARVQLELGGYPDEDSPCIALWVQCRTTGDQVEIDLHDELGRVSLHLFASPKGAAAFLVSWSRRPLPRAVSTGPLAPPGPVASRPSAATAPVSSMSSVSSVSSVSPASPASKDQPWHPELALAYIAASGLYRNWGTVTALLIQRSGIWSYGAGLRGVIGQFSNSPCGEGAAMFGVGDVVSERFSALTGLMVTSTIAGLGPSVGDFGYGSRGIRGSLHGTVRWRLTASLDIEARLAYDLVRFTTDTPVGVMPPANTVTYAAFSHVDLGMRWVP